jgi:hypothetical protein
MSRKEEKANARSVSGPVAGAAAAPVSQRRPRRAYDSPQLIEWGSLVDLTRGGAGKAKDFDFITTKAV